MPHVPVPGWVSVERVPQAFGRLRRVPEPNWRFTAVAWARLRPEKPPRWCFLSVATWEVKTLIVRVGRGVCTLPALVRRFQNVPEGMSPGRCEIGL